MPIKSKPIGRRGVEIFYAESSNSPAIGNVVARIEKAGNAKIGYLNVKPGYQRNGIGGKLLKATESWAKGKGAKQNTGNIMPVPGSERSVVNLFARKGYTVDTRRGTFNKTF